MNKDLLQADSDLHTEQDSDFSKIIEAGLSRRRFLQGGATAMGLFLAASPLASAVAATTNPDSKLLGFTKVPASTADTFVRLSLTIRIP